MSAPSALEASEIVFLDDPSASDHIQDLSFTVDELSREFGIAARTIRDYERRGLLRSERLGLGRVYRQRERVTLEAIVRARRIGLSIFEIQKHLTGNDGPFRSPTLNLPLDQYRARIEKLRRERSQIDEAINGLEVLLAQMQRSSAR